MSGGPWIERTWDRIPFPELDDDQLAAICDKHGLGRPPISRMTSTGVINAIYALGEQLVLRVPKPGLLEDTYTESVAVPAAVAAGVRTPAMVVFDDDRDILDVPFNVYERVNADTLAFVGGDLDEAYRGLGRDVAKLHATVTAVDDPYMRLDDPGRVETAQPAHDAALHGFLGDVHVRWVEDVFEAVAPALQEAKTHRRFVHDDLQRTNVMVRDGVYAAMIDWGDAGWGDPALDLCYLPIDAVPHALAGYREVMEIDGADTIEARVLWDHVWDALHNLRNRPDATMAPEFRPGAQFVELLAFAVSDEGRRFVQRALGG